MGQTVRSRLGDRRERRELGSDWRAGRFPRDSAYALNVAFARRSWRALAVVASVPAVFIIPWALWFTDGILRGIVIGAAAISGPWLAFLAVISYSGAATLWISAAAEEWTVAALRRDKRWRLVNDLYLDQQIDHVAVGPKGILVVETKWAADAWDPDDRFMADRLERSRRQAAAGRKKVEWWLRPKRHGAPVYGALVLWSPRGADGVQVDPPLPGQVSVVPARHLAAWLSEIPQWEDTAAVVPAVWAALRDRVRVVEAKRAETKGPPREQLVHRLTRSFVWPVVAVGAALYMIGLIAAAPWWPLIPTMLVAATGAGVVARQRAPARPAAHAWMATNIGLLLLWIGLVINNLLR